MKNADLLTITNALQRLGFEVRVDALPDLAEELAQIADSTENMNFEKRLKLSRMHSSSYFRDYIDKKDRGIDSDMLKELLTLSFMEKRENIVFWGSPGTGKSWLAQMIATSACKANKRVRWVDFQPLYRELENLKTNMRRFESRLNYYSKFDLLCIDEFLNCPLEDSYAIQEFFKRIDDIGQCTLIICCQSNPINWSKLFSITSFGESIRGRILCRAKLINTKGEDLRLCK
uniref:AAA+ ATPase domain-containing protein n=1 Tax=uncultured prokaryote TaxID=198431 RepID=A0A0H5PVX3_9ZZZZ|nr:hypothetical protein [uncultured prokaryote]